MHNIPLTELEENGLRQHHFLIGQPSALSDAFRLGVAWAISNQDSANSTLETKSKNLIFAFEQILRIQRLYGLQSEVGLGLPPEPLNMFVRALIESEHISPDHAQQLKSLTMSLFLRTSSDNCLFDSIDPKEN